RVRPVAYQSFHTPLWEALFGSLDAGQTKVPLETRHPFLDLRLLRYMFAVPVIPWCRAKHLERHAMRGILPNSVLTRPKSPLARDPVWEGMRSNLPSVRVTPMLRDYVDCSSLPKEAGDDMVLFRVNIRPFALNYWLQNLHQKPYQFT